MADGDESKAKGGAVQTIGIAIGGAVLGALATITTGAFDYLHKTDELKVHMVEIAIGILHADPKDDVTAARGWALDVIEKNSGVRFSQEDREVLLKKALSISSSAGWTDYSSNSGPPESKPPKK